MAEIAPLFRLAGLLPYGQSVEKVGQFLVLPPEIARGERITSPRLAFPQTRLRKFNCKDSTTRPNLKLNRYVLGT